ncbi:MAG TPA: BON domain-containing protein [Burkholderiales bacterium]|nr:BON domain-containing protein [Burkholderiales bacterium]
MRTVLAAVSVALGLALGATGCATQKQDAPARTSGEFTDDAAITAKVKSAIASDVGARVAAAVNVDTYKGVVSLSGFADSAEQVDRTLTAAKKVNGVKQIKNELRVKS